MVIPKVNLNTLVRPKIFWPSIIILLIVSFSLYTLKEKEKSLRIAKELELQQTVEAKKVVENKLVDAKKEIIAKDEQIKLDLDKLENEITARKEAETQLLAVTKEKQALEEKVEKLTTVLPKNAETQLLAVTKEKQAPEEKVEKLTTVSPSIELEKIEIKSARELVGKVLAIDKEHGFVLTDLGNENNLKLGDVLSVYRDGEFIGRVQVEKVEEKSSAAAVVSPWKNVEFKENDMVKIL